MTALLTSIVGAAANAWETLTGSSGGDAKGGESTEGAFASALAQALAPPSLPGAGVPQGEATAGATAGAAALAATAGAAGATPAPVEPQEEAALTAVVAAASDPRTGKVDPKRVHRGAELLDPEFRARFDRVVERMSREFGHKVQVVETWRDPARQALLYEQGRSTPGPVVTWTKNSNHSQGRAADVMIDGTYDNALGYSRLARIAMEEGLRTLGPKDPGHVELPRTGSERLASAPAAPTSAGAAAPSAHPHMPNAAVQRFSEGIARVAQVAQVATVAAVAQVARVATVARPGAGASADVAASLRGGQPEAPAEGATAAQTAVAAQPVSARTLAGDGSARDERHREEAAEAVGLAELSRESTGSSDASRPELASGSRSVQAAGRAAPDASGGITGVDTVGRIARMLDLQASAANRPMTHMLLRMEGPTGSIDQIRVGLRGSSVDATLEIGDALDASRLGSRVDALSRALEQHGLEAESVRIRASAALETPELSRVAAMSAEAEAVRVTASRNTSESGAGRDQGGKSGHEQPRQRDDDRNRSDREPKQRNGQ